MRLNVRCESSLTHLLAYERKLKEEAEATKGETKLKGGHKKRSMPFPSADQTARTTFAHRRQTCGRSFVHRRSMVSQLH
jgi:hypothetical protein